MKLRSIDILLVSAELKQARLCFQLGRMFSRMFSWEEKSGATLLSLRRYCVCEELKAHLLKCRLMGIFLKVAQNLFDVDDFRA